MRFKTVDTAEPPINNGNSTCWLPDWAKPLVVVQTVKDESVEDLRSSLREHHEYVSTKSMWQGNLRRYLYSTSVFQVQKPLYLIVLIRFDAND